MDQNLAPAHETPDTLEAPATTAPAWTGLANPRRTRIWDLSEIA